MYEIKKDKLSKDFLTKKLFWLGIIGTYIIAGVMLNKLENNADYDDLILISIIPSSYYFFMLFLSYKSFKDEAIRTTILQFTIQILLLLPLMSMYMAVLLFSTKIS
tara:strand:- start:885 stop:1202 length:318 start_codon:yes stop_codon:yes gene_type:complete